MPSVYDAICALANVCDGAIALDDMGFNASDTHFGRYLATVPEDDWDSQMLWAAWSVLRKYKTQLAEYNIDYDEIPVPDPVEGDGREHARSAYQSIKEREKRKCLFVSGSFSLLFPYNKQLVADLKEAIGYRDRQFDGRDKRWRIATSAAKELQAFVTENNFTISPDAQAAFDNPTQLTKDQAQGSQWYGRVEELDGGLLALRFPYNPALVNEIKASIPGRRWNPQKKCWTVPTSSAEEVYAFATKHNLQIGRKLGVELREVAERQVAMREGSRAESGTLEIDGLGGTLRPFQVAGVEYAATSRRCFIADQMGLGKTVQGLALLRHEQAFPCVVVCPASVKLQWEREARKWLPGVSVEVLSGKVPTHVSPSTEVLIINYDILSDWAPYLASLNLQAVILDESHFIKSEKATRTRSAILVTAKVRANDGLIVFLTGTPVLNRPVELVAQLAAMDRLDEVFGGRKKFRSRYCWDEESYSYTGARNLEELNKKLRSTCYIRRTKDQVATELPEKARYTVTMQGDSQLLETYRKFEKTLKVELSDEARELANELGIGLEEVFATPEWKSKEAKQLTKIGKLRQLVAAAKLTDAFEWIEAFVDSGGKLVVFAHHRAIQEAIATKFKAPAITGGMTNQEKDAAIRAFQSNSPVIVCSIQAAGMGVDGLQVASDVLFLEQSWTPAILEQAEDRLHRMGQRDCVTAWYAEIPGTIDRYLFSVLKAKAQVVEGTINGREAGAVQTEADVIAAFAKGDL